MNSENFPIIAYTDGETEKTQVGFKKTTAFIWHIENFSRNKWRKIVHSGCVMNGPVFKIDPFTHSSWKIEMGRKLMQSYILSATVRKVTACPITSKFTLIWNVESGKYREVTKKVIIVEAHVAKHEVSDYRINDVMRFLKSDESANMTIEIEVDDSAVQRTTDSASYDSNAPCMRSSLDKGKLAVLGDMESILKEAAFSDVILTAESQKIRAHRTILAGRSVVFKSMFEHQMSEKASGSVDISGISFDSLQRLVTYLYSGRLDDLDVESASELFVASDRYAVEDLHGTCSLFLKSNMTVDNCLGILMLADLHSNADLKSFAIEFFSGNSKTISEKPEWDDMLKVRPSVAFELFKVLAAK